MRRVELAEKMLGEFIRERFDLQKRCEELEQENKVLLGENSHLRNHCGTLEVEVEQSERRVKMYDLQQENEKLKEMLRMSNIFDSVFRKDDCCMVCGNRPHTKDCEYVKLTK